MTYWGSDAVNPFRKLYFYYIEIFLKVSLLSLIKMRQNIFALTQLRHIYSIIVGFSTLLYMRVLYGIMRIHDLRV